MAATRLARNRSDEADEKRATMRPSKALAPPSTSGAAASSAARKSGRRASILGAAATIVASARAPAPDRLAVEVRAGMLEPRLVGEDEAAVAANAP